MPRRNTDIFVKKGFPPWGHFYITDVNKKLFFINIFPLAGAADLGKYQKTH